MDKKDVTATKYYVHRSYIPVYYYLYTALEDWIADNIFREDNSRVFLASDAYAFRRRFELTDTSIDYNDLEVSSLRFPFANYWPMNSGWEPDTRVAANQASLIYDGISIGTTKVRVAPGIINVPVTFYFDREDDARLAYEKLYFFTFNEHYYGVPVSYGENTIGVPMEVSVSGIKFNPSFNEKDWLAKNRIFIVTANFALRSFIFYPPEQPNYKWKVDASGNLTNEDYGVGGKYDDGIPKYYTTDEVILNMENFHDLRFHTITEKGTFEESSIEVDLLRVTDISSSSATIEWKIKNKDTITGIELRESSLKRAIDIDPSMTSYCIDNLQQDSVYNFYITFYSKNTASKTLGVSVHTSESQETIMKKSSPANVLVGLKF